MPLDMLAEYHYDQITAILKERGMGHYGEAHESGRAFIGDGMEAKRTNDVPMAAMWTQRPGVNAEQHGFNADIRESASVAHLYGQNLVAAESLTAASGAWAWSPATLKPTADKELAMGLNRFVIHTSVHQPLVDKGPGLGLGPFGQWFTRNETWAEPAKAWVSYLARSSFMLQQGRFVADIAYFYGEDSNVTALFDKQAPADSGRLQLRLCQRACARAPAVGLGWPTGGAERHAVPRARARSEQPAHVAAGTSQDPAIWWRPVQSSADRSRSRRRA